jgi:hypothetical protein
MKRHLELAFECEENRSDPGVLLDKAIGFSGKIEECPKTENTMRMYPKNVIFSRVQFRSFDQRDREVVPVPVPNTPLSDP